jgi:hypothetical protein
MLPNAKCSGLGEGWHRIKAASQDKGMLGRDAQAARPRAWAECLQAAKQGASACAHPPWRQAFAAEWSRQHPPATYFEDKRAGC